MERERERERERARERERERERECVCVCVCVWERERERERETDRQKQVGNSAQSERFHIMFSKFWNIIGSVKYSTLTLVLLRGGCTNPPNGYRPGAQNRTAKG